ncbi:MAG: HEAT repeat domain-containing protein [Planctomycetia bacterium]
MSASSLAARHRAQVLALLLAGLGACAGPAPAVGTGVRQAPRARSYDEGGEATRQQVQAAIAAFEQPAAQQVMEASARLARIGEPSVVPLLEALRAHPSGRTRSLSAYTLGFLRDRRVVEPLGAALRDPDATVQLEAATALLRLGDDRGARRLVDALEDADARVRARALRVLQEAVGSTWGYRVDDDAQDRAAAVARWRSWLQQRGEGRS